jgi:protein arginine kinase
MNNWYLESGRESSVVISTRIRLARNFKDIPFGNKMTKNDAERVIKEFEKILPKLRIDLKILRLKDMDNLTKLSLIEKHIISHNFAMEKSEIGAIAINQEENICIMLNEEDHIRLQLFSAGLELKNIYKLAEELDENIWVGKLDCDKYQQIAKDCGVTGFPSFALFKNGEKVLQFAGLHTKGQILNKLMRYI